MRDSGTPTTPPAIHGSTRTRGAAKRCRMVSPGTNPCFLRYVWVTFGIPKLASTLQMDPRPACIRPAQACLRPCTHPRARLRIHPLTSRASHTTIIFGIPNRESSRRRRALVVSTAVRLGFISPSSNTAMEPAVSALVIGHGSAHFTRIGVTRIELDGHSDDQFDVAGMEAAARLLTDVRVDVVD